MYLEPKSTNEPRAQYAPEPARGNCFGRMNEVSNEMCDRLYRLDVDRVRVNQHAVYLGKGKGCDTLHCRIVGRVLISFP